MKAFHADSFVFLSSLHLTNIALPVVCGRGFCLVLSPSNGDNLSSNYSGYTPEIGRDFPSPQTTGTPQFLKYSNKTDRPLEAIYAISCSAYISDGFNERSITWTSITPAYQIPELQIWLLLRGIKSNAS